MTINEKSTIHFGVYTKEAMQIIKAAIDRKSFWRMPITYIRQDANGEVIFNDRSYYPRTFSEAEKKDLKRKLGTKLLSFAQHIAESIGVNEAASTMASLRDCKTADTEYTYDIGGSHGKVTTTIKKIIFLAEFFQGYKDINNIKKKYDKALVDSLIGNAAGAFETASVNILLEEIFKVTSEKEAALLAFDKEKNAQRELICGSWDAKIKDLKSQIETIRENAKIAVNG